MKGFFQNKKILLLFCLILIVLIAVIVLLITGNKTEYIVTFDTDGGSAIAAMKVKKGNKLNLPANPTKEGFEFIGWTLNNEEFDNDKEITSNISLKAKWEVETYIVTFNTNGGSTIESIKLKKGETLKLPTNPTKDGYNFAGWVDKNETPIYNDALIDGDITLNAIWNAKKYTCPNGYTLSGTNCTKKTTTNATATEYECKTYTNDGYTTLFKDEKKCGKFSSYVKADYTCAVGWIQSTSDKSDCYSGELASAGIDKYTCENYYKNVSGGPAYYSNGRCFSKQKDADRTCSNGRLKISYDALWYLFL